MSSPYERYEAQIEPIRTKLNDLSRPRDAEIRKLLKERAALIPSSKYEHTMDILNYELKESHNEVEKEEIRKQIATLTEATKTPEGKEEADVEINKQIEAINAKIEMLEADPTIRGVSDAYILLSTELMQPIFKRAKK
jgi:hypothetical protein